MTTNNGSPAFPIIGTSGQVLELGLSIRDYFAAKAMQGLITKGMDDYEDRGVRGVPVIAKYSYEYADAMLAAMKGVDKI